MEKTCTGACCSNRMAGFDVCGILTDESVPLRLEVLNLLLSIDGPVVWGIMGLLVCLVVQ